MNAAIYNGGYKGIHRDDSRSKWFAKIHIGGTSLFLGRYEDFDDAVEAREKAEAAISLLGSMDATNIHISSVKNCNKVIAGILPKNGFNFKFEIQLDLPRAPGVTRQQEVDYEAHRNYRR